MCTCIGHSTSRRFLAVCTERAESNDPVAKSTPGTQNLVSKDHLPIMEPGLPGERKARKRQVSVQHHRVLESKIMEKTNGEPMKKTQEPT